MEWSEAVQLVRAEARARRVRLTRRRLKRAALAVLGLEQAERDSVRAAATESNVTQPRGPGGRFAPKKGGAGG